LKQEKGRLTNKRRLSGIHGFGLFFTRFQLRYDNCAWHDPFAMAIHHTEEWQADVRLHITGGRNDF
jgi:hypothetical protein